MFSKRECQENESEEREEERERVHFIFYSKVFTPISSYNQVIGDDFLSDPCLAPHDCTPVAAIKDKVDRITYKVSYR